ncbi:hypothetical protein ACOZ4I_06475 [Haloarcula salina]|uniref:hypothetical protein n=1 Tax=Haloarcula salina TaxID=1429914 RepID=UPI003C6F7EFD
MGRNTAAINYGIGSLFGNTFNMYLYGSGILTLLNFLIGLIETQSVGGAVAVAINYFVAKLTPFPLNEFLTATGFIEVLVNVAIALGVGVIVATFKYWNSQY